MELSARKRVNKYDRVMSRVKNISRNSLNSSSLVTRHEIPSSVSVGAKPSVSNVSSSIVRELPIALNNYIPEVPSRKKFVVKPRRTIPSLNPAKSPHRHVPATKSVTQKVPKILTRNSAPVISNSDSEKWTDMHIRQCYSSRSHCRLKELKDEIKAYQETEKQTKLRSQLYQSCGVILDDFGQVAADKAVQVQGLDTTKTDMEREAKRSPQRYEREDAGAPMPDQQMRFTTARYPVERYLVENSKTVEMVNIIDDEIWNSEPAMRPEDEIILKKLQDMLQSTADDLKVLSGELCKINQPGVKIKSQPAPLDEEFNEKVHIEEIVNAKFHGHKIVENPLPFLTEFKPNKDVVNDMLVSKNQNHKAIKDMQTNSKPSTETKLHRNLKITRLKAVHINENNISNKVNIKKIPTVSYDEMIHNNADEHKKEKNIKEKQLQIQAMPSINIRSEMKEQSVLHLNIFPETTKKSKKHTNDINNVGVFEIMHSQIPHEIAHTKDVTPKNHKNSSQLNKNTNYKTYRKTYKMSTYESSESTNNLSSDVNKKINLKQKIKLATKTSPTQTSKNIQNKKKVVNKRLHLNIDEWKKKLNSIYGQPSISRSRSTTLKSRRISPKKPSNFKSTSKSNTFKNGEYIPYNKLTLGGVRVSDIEREIEISEISNNNDLSLSPILDKILSSRENSFHKDSPKNRKNKHTPKILSTSDENLLQEVIDIEKTVSETLSKDFKNTTKCTHLDLHEENLSNEDSNDSYADDFEDEKSEEAPSSKHGKNIQNDKSDAEQNKDENCRNITYTKVSNLSFKDSVDIFEYIHSVDTQDMGTQSNSTSKISLKDTQTSHGNEKRNIEPIYNDLRASIDPRGEIESLFQLEKEFIKKLIIDEYGEVIENNIMKPSTSKCKDSDDMKNNMAAFQKNTQTSPARVKHAMTSPTKTKTRTTSPFSLSLTVDRQTSPMFLNNNEELKIIIDHEPDDLGISINLSSPRFSLRLPQNSREVLSNLDNYSGIVNSKSRINLSNVSGAKHKSMNVVSSSSSMDAESSSSEIRSLGEVKLNLKKNIRRTLNRSISESSSASTISQTSTDVRSGEILPLKSEGELSLGQVKKKIGKSRYKDS